MFIFQNFHPFILPMNFMGKFDENWIYYSNLNSKSLSFKGLDCCLKKYFLVLVHTTGTMYHVHKIHLLTCILDSQNRETKRSAFESIWIWIDRFQVKEWSFECPNRPLLNCSSLHNTWILITKLVINFTLYFSDQFYI